MFNFPDRYPDQDEVHKFLKHVQHSHHLLRRELPDLITCLNLFQQTTAPTKPIPQDTIIQAFIKETMNEIEDSFSVLKEDKETLSDEKITQILICNPCPINLAEWVTQKKKHPHSFFKNQSKSLHEQKAVKLLEHYLLSPVDCSAFEIPEVKQLTKTIQVLKKFHSVIHIHFPAIWQTYLQQYYSHKDTSNIKNKRELLSITDHLIRKTMRLLVILYRANRESDWHPSAKNGLEILQKNLHDYGKIWLRGLYPAPLAHNTKQQSTSSLVSANCIPSNDITHCDYDCSTSSIFIPNEYLIITDISKSDDSLHVVSLDSDDEDTWHAQQSLALVGIPSSRPYNVSIYFKSSSDINFYGECAQTYCLNYDDFCKHIQPFENIKFDTYTLQHAEDSNCKHNKDYTDIIRQYIPIESWLKPRKTPLKKALTEQKEEEEEDFSSYTDHESDSSQTPERQINKKTFPQKRTKHSASEQPRPFQLAM